jgi:hypothetical protein
MCIHPFRRPTIIDLTSYKPDKKRPKIQPWLKIMNVNMYDSDREALLSPVGWLTDSIIVTVFAKRDHFTQNVKSCYWPVKFTCPIGNALAGATSSENNFRTT